MKRIRLNKTKSINSINSKNTINVNIKNTTNTLPHLNIVKDVDVYEVFNNERENCEKYRLILTINPYCTNILFNTFTEITRNEGSSEQSGDNKLEYITDSGKQKVANGKEESIGINTPNRKQMLMNTEYSKNSIGYEYHLGYDIFTNHILRNLSFKLVNNISQKTANTLTGNSSDEFCGTTLSWSESESRSKNLKLIFNTIGDVMRYSDGTVIQYRKREKIDLSPNTDLNKHLYIHDDILTFEDSINQNLTEENGWFGVSNNSTISSKIKSDKYHPSTNKLIWNDLNISRLINSKENCEFIDMYPDRKLFSFNPLLNKFKQRLEYNWSVILTYPYRNEYCHDIVTYKSSNGDETNGLKIMSVKQTYGLNGTSIFVFRTYIKHGLNRGDTIKLFINGKEISSVFKIANIGDMTDDNEKKLYYFYINENSILTTDIFTNKNNDYRLKKIVNGVESEYYIRVFKKLPNLKNKKEKLTQEIAMNHDAFENYIYGENLNGSTIKNYNNKEDAYMIDFNKEQYKLAFSRTIYNDTSTQITFTDDIDVKYLVDNIGRPLHEFYVTIIKTNKGYQEWYGIKQVNNEYKKTEPDIYNDNIEFSHCFGNVSSGFNISSDKDDNLIIDTDNLTNNLIYKKGEIGDIHLLNELNLFHATPYENNINEYGSAELKDEFYGDIVEFIPMECRENILETINHRFNTTQRELPIESDLNNFVYQEIKYDDYDAKAMTVEENKINTYINQYGKELKIWQRPEGYFYQAHYPITIKEFGNINQGEDFDISVKSTILRQISMICIEISSNLSINSSLGDIVFLCFDNIKSFSNDKRYKFTIVEKKNKNTIVIAPYNQTWNDLWVKLSTDTKTDIKEWNWVVLCNLISDGYIYTKDMSTISYLVKLRIQNTSIPFYAKRIDHNKLLWRDIYRVGEYENSEEDVLPYTNNSFYINKNINFFLKRQDPHNIHGLYCGNAFPNDIIGNENEENIYYYNDDTENLC